MIIHTSFPQWRNERDDSLYLICKTFHMSSIPFTCRLNLSHVVYTFHMSSKPFTCRLYLSHVVCSCHSKSLSPHHHHPTTIPDFQRVSLRKYSRSLKEIFHAPYCTSEHSIQIIFCSCTYCSFMTFYFHMIIISMQSEKELKVC